MQIPNPSVSQIATAAGYVALVTMIQFMLTTFREDIVTVDEPLQEYDYIVVGGGTAGSLVASKLTTLSSDTVLLIEAGGKVPWLSRIPTLFFSLLWTPIDWQFETEPQQYSHHGFVGRRARWSRGKLLGGTSGINGMVYFWPTPSDMNTWAERFNDSKWRFENMQRYFQDVENTEHVVGSSPNRGRNGGIRVSSFPCEESGLCQGFLEAAAYLGFPLRDVNSDQPYGFMPGQRTVHEGRRWTSVQGYLNEAASNHRDRLHILINSLASRVIIENKRARAVRIRRDDGREVTVRARKEVILSAGSVKTPQILMLSGIGPRQHLAQMGIPLVVDLPVGDNLLDHVCYFLHLNIDDSVGWTWEEFLDPRIWARYFMDFSGPPGQADTVAQGRLPRPNNKFGDMNFIVSWKPSAEPGSWSQLSNWKLRTTYLHFDGAGELRKPGFMFYLAQSQTQSRGYIRLNSTNPEAQPLIQPRYFSDQEDLDTVIDAVRVVDQIASSPPMRRLGARLHLPDFPECRPPNVPKSTWSPTVDSTYYMKCWVLVSAMGSWHHVGTAKMGQRGRPDTVVDPDFNVVGVDGLRVVDGSIFPEHVASNPMGTVLGIANLAADVILGDRERDRRWRDAGYRSSQNRRNSEIRQAMSYPYSYRREN